MRADVPSIVKVKEARAGFPPTRLTPIQQQHLDDGAYVGPWSNFALGQYRRKVIQQKGYDYTKVLIMDSRVPRGRGIIWKLTGVTLDNQDDAYGLVGSDGTRYGITQSLAKHRITLLSIMRSSRRRLN